MKICECGCGTPIESSARSNRAEPRFVKGHNFRLSHQMVKCPICRTEFDKTALLRKYCSDKCAKQAISDQRRRRVKRICLVCHTEFETHKYRSGSKYCSKACWSVRNPPLSHECRHCHKIYTSFDRKSLFCSRRCARKTKTGPLSSNWKGGISLENERARLMPERREWSRAVLKRDGFKCIKCGSKKNLHAHHVKPWAQFVDLRFVVSNGETLCEVCHGLVHGKNFANRRRKRCMTCGKKTSGRGRRCASCAIRRWHRQRVAALPAQKSLPFPPEPAAGS